jgi:voltage-gated potassium channel
LARYVGRSTLLPMAPDDSREKLGPFQFVILVLSFVLLAGIAAEWLLTLPNEISRLIFYIDTAVCFVFILDFIIRFRAAPSKWRFMRWGWIDLLASIPAVEALRFGRVFRIVRIVRLLATFHSLRGFFRALLESKAGAGAASVFVIAFLVISFASLGVLLVETSPESNITTAEEALWWSFVTVTTVGYGDYYPVTATGRLIATSLMITGIGLFGTLSGLAAGFFLGGREEETLDQKERRAIMDNIDALRRELAEQRTRNEETPSSQAAHPPSENPVPPDGRKS